MLCLRICPPPDEIDAGGGAWEERRIEGDAEQGVVDGEFARAAGDGEGVDVDPATLFVTQGVGEAAVVVPPVVAAHRRFFVAEGVRVEVKDELGQGVGRSVVVVDALPGFEQFRFGVEAHIYGVARLLAPVVGRLGGGLGTDESAGEDGDESRNPHGMRLVG